MSKNKKLLLSKLKKENIFWQYDKPDLKWLSDEAIIENTIIYLDVDEIDLLFSIYDRDLIKDVWIKKIVPIDRLYSLNKLIAYVYFGIKKPDKFINKIHENKIQNQ